MNSTYNKGRFQAKRPQQPKEDYAIILDIITDHNESFKDTQIAQAIGYTTYTLFELVPKPGVLLKVGQKVYIGNEKRDEIQYIKRVLFYDKLTGTASSELKYVIMDIIDEKEEEYVNFFNNSGPISLRRHSLELISGVGKKHLKHLIDLREESPFKNFADIRERCSFLANPQEAIADRIIAELEGRTDHKFFVKR